MNNIERFNLLTTYILGRLYASFPVATAINRAQAINDIPECFIGEGDKARSIFIGQTLQWLEETEYVIGRGNPGAGREFVLSPRAFEAMNIRLPTSLRRKEEETTTVGDRMAEVARDAGGALMDEGRKQVASQLVGAILSHSVRLVLGGA